MSGATQRKRPAKAGEVSVSQGTELSVWQMFTTPSTDYFEQYRTTLHDVISQSTLAGSLQPMDALIKISELATEARKPVLLELSNSTPSFVLRQLAAIDMAALVVSVGILNRFDTTRGAFPTKYLTAAIKALEKRKELYEIISAEFPSGRLTPDNIMDKYNQYVSTTVSGVTTRITGATSPALLGPIHATSATAAAAAAAASADPLQQMAFESTITTTTKTKTKTTTTASIQSPFPFNAPAVPVSSLSSLSHTEGARKALPLLSPSGQSPLQLMPPSQQ